MQESEPQMSKKIKLSSISKSIGYTNKLSESNSEMEKMEVDIDKND